MHFYTKQLKTLHPNRFAHPTTTDVRQRVFSVPNMWGRNLGFRAISQ